MRLNIVPKKCARITHKNRRMVLANKKIASQLICSDTATENNKSVEFNFEVLSPSMQIEERNSAYKFFSL